VSPAIDDAPDEPRRPEEHWRGEQIAPRAVDPVGGEPVPPDGADEDLSQALSRRRFLGGAGAASLFLVAGGAAVVAADEGVGSGSANPRRRPPTTTPSFLDGNFAPVTVEVTATQLAVTGAIPPELVGRLVRNGPNPEIPTDPDRYHWFTGDGMVHGVRLREGRAEWYRNRRPRGGEEVPNTHIIGVDGRTFALVEAGDKPVELSYELESLGTNPFDGTLDGSFSAHTHLDPATGDRHAVTYYWEWDDHIRHVVLGPDARVTREVRVPLAGGPMVHDCAITENYVVLFDLPVTFSRDAAVEGAPFPYRWNPDHPPRVGLLPRDGDGTDARWFDAPTCYVLHALNAYETGGAVVIDVVRHPRLFATLLNGPYEGPPSLQRWTLNLASGALTTDTLDDHPWSSPASTSASPAIATAMPTRPTTAKTSSTAPPTSTTWQGARPWSTSTARAESPSSHSSCPATTAPPRTTAGSSTRCRDARLVAPRGRHPVISATCQNGKVNALPVLEVLDLARLAGDPHPFGPQVLAQIRRSSSMRSLRLCHEAPGSGTHGRWVPSSLSTEGFPSRTRRSFRVSPIGGPPRPGGIGRRRADEAAEAPRKTGFAGADPG
jgi:Retinal pigment epithelial membrane protein